MQTSFVSSDRPSPGRTRWAALAAAAVLALAGCGEDPPAPVEGDADGDFIPDALEGADLDPPRDTDGDGLPDFQDLDSDADGLPDALEAGDFDRATSPVDTDGDGDADFVDLDSDDNGIPDWDEGTGDWDGDGIPDFRDLDDDEDLLTDDEEIRGIFLPMLDTDGDGVPNYRDPDSDNDLILDGHERLGDSDGDGLADAYDLNSDGDCDSDAVEAGDRDLRTIPIDTDGDSVPDFRDRDSDNDGLSDAFECAFAGGRLDRRKADSDGDGTSDLIEVGAGSDPLDPDDDPESRGDFVFLVEYEEPPAPDRRTLQFGTALRFADVYFSLDTTGSMTQEFAALRQSVPAIVEQLSCSLQPEAEAICEVVDPGAAPPENLPLNCGARSNPADPTSPWVDDPDRACFDGLCARRCLSDDDCGDGFGCRDGGADLVCVRECVRNADCASGYLCDRADGEASGVCREDALATGCLEELFTGVGRWNEIDTFSNALRLQGDPQQTSDAVGDVGGGAAEAPFQAAACVADGANCLNDGTKNCADDGVGCPGFRPDAIRILVQITDADDQCGANPRCPLFSASFSGAELLRQGIYFIGLYGTGDEGGLGTAQSVARDLAVASASVDEDEEPFIFPAIDGEVVAQTVRAVRSLVGGGNFRITAEVIDEPNDAGDSLQFVERLEVNRDPSRADCTPVLFTTDEDGDGFDDTFPRLRPGTPVCWDLVARGNDVVRPVDAPQVYRARVVVRANGSKVDERRVFFLVPPIPVDQPPG